MYEELSSVSNRFPDTLDLISKYIFTSKYARYDEVLGRRETWNEAIGRVEDMHLRKFSHLSEEDLSEINKAFDLVRDKRTLPSMRSIQFGGKAIEAINLRQFNCAVRHIDSLRAFSESFYLLLCGCGVGFGLSDKYLSRLPNLVGPEDKTGTVMTYVVEDNIEGWSDSIEALLNCYFVNTAYSGRKVVFDYSKIRPEGSPLKTGGGKAPGYKGLKAAHTKIKALLDRIIEVDGLGRLRSIDAYDILMHVADAVLSGGIRRSACSVMFDKNDEDMMNAKTGDWFIDNPQRARSNNSVLLIRDQTSEEELQEIIAKTREWGEPGFVFADNEDVLFNPCQPAWAPILTPDGIKTLGNIEAGDSIWSETGWVKVTKKWSTGVKPVYRYTTTAGSFYGTDNHRLVSGGTKIEARDAESVDRLTGPKSLMEDSWRDLNPNDIMAGLVIGDGTPNHKTGSQVQLVIGRDDQDYFSSEISSLIGEKKSDLTYEVKTDVSVDELANLPERAIPDRYFYADRKTVTGFLRGLYTANGSVVRNRVTLKTSSPLIRDQVQVMLSSIGIGSYFTTNTQKDVVFSNGTYECKESYDINITSDRGEFFKSVGFIQLYKMNKLDKEISLMKNPYGGGKATFDIVSQELLGEEEVFDITVDNGPHTYWTGGLNVSNCFEIQFMPVTKDGVCGVQVCNLTTVNGSKVESEEDFYEAVAAAALIGTLQAAYTDFKYLSRTAEKLTVQESLLGVSITAMMESPDILFDPEVQRKGAAIAVETNKIWAEKIGIPQAARVTTIKPEGTSTLAVGSMASGIHAAHARFMFRRVQANVNDNVYKFFKSWMPELCEPSVLSANNTDDVITFPIMVPEKSIFKSDLGAISHLDMVKSTQENWVIPGTSEVNEKPITHNVSCTVIVKDNEWDSVASYLYINRDKFAAVSLISDTGDKDYQQAPMEAVSTEEDKERFIHLMNNVIPIDFTMLMEDEDGTSLLQEAACAGGACEIV